MLNESIPLSSINDPKELQQRTEYCRRFMRCSTQPYYEWYCDGQTLRISHESDDEIEEYNLVEDLNYYENFPACVEDWAVAIAQRIIDGSTIELGEEERKEVKEVVANALATSPAAVRHIIGTAVIEENYFGLQPHERSEVSAEENGR